jgi:hypothetical protein
MLMILIVW